MFVQFFYYTTFYHIMTQVGMKAIVLIETFSSDSSIPRFLGVKFPKNACLLCVF